MIIAASSEQAQHRRHRQPDNPNRLDANGKSTASTRTTYIGLDPNEMKGKPAPEPDAMSPMAFLVEQDAGSILNTHFHKADQFQVFVHGDGKIANHPISGVCIQFTGAYSPYGPIVAGSHGLDYFTLRNNYLAKAYFMPAAREERRAGNLPHREVFGDVAAPRPIEVLVAASVVEATSVIAETPDGLAAWRYLVPRGQTVTGPDPSRGTGQFWMVLSGGLADQPNGLMPAKSCVFVSPDEAPYVAVAGPEGLDILAAQFPMKPV